MDNIKIGLMVIGLTILALLAIGLLTIMGLLNIDFFIATKVFPFIPSVPLYWKIPIGIFEIVGVCWLLGYAAHKY